jgi:hypothetical protein
MMDTVPLMLSEGRENGVLPKPLRKHQSFFMRLLHNPYTKHKFVSNLTNFL